MKSMHHCYRHVGVECDVGAIRSIQCFTRLRLVGTMNRSRWTYLLFRANMPITYNIRNYQCCKNGTALLKYFVHGGTRQYSQSITQFCERGMFSAKWKLQHKVSYLFLLCLLVMAFVFMEENALSRPSTVSSLQRPMVKMTAREAEEDLKQEFKERRETVRKYCEMREAKHQLPAAVLRYFSFSPKQKLVYCGIQKVGTSFLIRVMQVLQGRKREEHFFDRTLSHSIGIRGKYSFMTKTEEERKRLLDLYSKFIFVRDPYSRLFSAFMDKIYLPKRRMRGIAKRDLQFKMEGRYAKLLHKSSSSNAGVDDESNIDDKNMEEEGRDKQHHKGNELWKNLTNKGDNADNKDGGKGENQDQMAVTASHSAVTAQCLLNVTFETFLRVVVTESYHDHHWGSMISHCMPCEVDFEFVGKMETFRRDLEFILNQVGADSLQFFKSQPESFDIETDKRAITDLVRLMDTMNTGAKLCSDPDYNCQLMRRIWTTLLARGLVSKSVQYPFEGWGCQDVRNKSMACILRAFYQEAGRRKERMRQREEAMFEAYSRIPRELLKQVEAYVKIDCDVFGYECSAEKRFPPSISARDHKMWSYFDDYS